MKIICRIRKEEENERIAQEDFPKSFSRKCICFFLAMLNVLLNIINTRYNGILINYLTTQTNIGKIRSLVLLIILINIISLITLYLYNIKDVSLKNKMSFAIVEEINDAIFEKNIEDISIYEPVYLSQRIEDDATDVIVFLIDNVIETITNVSTLIIVGYIFIGIDIRFVIVFVLFVPFYVITYKALKTKIYETSLKFKENQNRFSERYYEQFLLLEEDKTHVNKNRKGKLRKNYTKFYLSLLKFTRLKTLFSISDNIISFFIQICVLALGAMLVIKKELSIGSFVVITIYYMYAIKSLKYFLELGQQYQLYKVANNRLEEIINIKNEVKGRICEDINYIKIQMDEIEQIIGEGKIYAIVGRNGSGKTTLLKNIYGIYNTGYVKFNEKRNMLFNLDKMRKDQFSILIQEERTPCCIVIEYLKDATELDEQSIMKILFGRLRSICYNDFFNISDILDKEIDLISRGEKQCVLIIKTLIKEKKIYILDEFSNNIHFSFVDIIMNYIRQDIQKNNKKIYILVTHDKKIIEASDELIVI